MLPMRLRILIVEDHKDLAENLFEYFGDETYQLDYAADGLTALHLLAVNTYDLVILDVMLPGVDGITICQRIRNDLNSNVPVLILTAKDSLADKEKGFNVGADDYLVKPFHLRELELRMQALCRRLQLNTGILKADGFVYDPDTLTVTGECGKVELSGYGASIFEALMRQYPKYVDHATLAEMVWGNDSVDVNTLRTHVYSLRKTLGQKFKEDIIKTLHGRGYCLDFSSHSS